MNVVPVDSGNVRLHDVGLVVLGYVDPDLRLDVDVAQRRPEAKSLEYIVNIAKGIEPGKFLEGIVVRDVCHGASPVEKRAAAAPELRLPFKLAERPPFALIQINGQIYRGCERLPPVVPAVVLCRRASETSSAQRKISAPEKHGAVNGLTASPPGAGQLNAGAVRVVT